MRSSLVAIRSLGKKKINITAGSEINNAMGLYSKYCKKSFIYPNPRTETSQFLVYLHNLVEQNNYDCIIPFHTYTAFLLSKYRDIFSEYTRIPPPNFDVFYNAYNKIKLLKIAIKNKIPCPKTYFSDDLKEIINSINNYPVVVKPSKRHGIKIAICNTQNDLKEKYSKMTEKYDQCIVQDYVPNGGEYGIYTIFNNNSEPIALSVHKRLRTMHAYGGISTLRKTIKNEELVKLAFKLLKTINWSGAAMVEFRIDSRDNRPKLMEINPRFWGSLQLSILSGIDFPYKLYQLTMENDPKPELNYKENIYCRWLLMDLTNLFQSPDKVKKIIDLCRPDVHNDVVSIIDPKPGFISMFKPNYDSSDEEPREDNGKIMNEVISKLIK